MLDTLIQFFTQWGYLGLLLGSFMAGSIIPFSSEALVIASDWSELQRQIDAAADGAWGESDLAGLGILPARERTVPD